MFLKYAKERIWYHWNFYACDMKWFGSVFDQIEMIWICFARVLIWYGYDKTLAYLSVLNMVLIWWYCSRDMVGTTMIWYECTHFGNKVVFLRVLSCVHTRDSEIEKWEVYYMILPGLATGDSTTLPRGLNMVYDMIW